MRTTSFDSPRINWPAVVSREPLGPFATSLTKLRKNIVPYGHVYIFPALGRVKIGMTMHSAYRRWHQIKTANPWLEAPLYVSPPLLGQVMIVEKACHGALAQYWVCGEWFECDRQLALDTVRRIIHG